MIVFANAINHGYKRPEMKLLLVTGFCGGFTTFSTFARSAQRDACQSKNVSFGMMKTGDALLMALYVGASVIIGILAVWGRKKLAGG